MAGDEYTTADPVLTDHSFAPELEIAYRWASSQPTYKVPSLAMAGVERTLSPVLKLHLDCGVPAA
jgi:hypothetical protein